jgi:hypothetical protein
MFTNQIPPGGSTTRRGGHFTSQLVDGTQEAETASGLHVLWRLFLQLRSDKSAMQTRTFGKQEVQRDLEKRVEY